MSGKRDMSQKFRIQTSYSWIETYEETLLVKMYFINYVPFTFDELPAICYDDPAILMEANKNKVWTQEELFKCSAYLAQEECLPLLHELEIENPEELPQD